MKWFNTILLLAGIIGLFPGKLSAQSCSDLIAAENWKSDVVESSHTFSLLWDQDYRSASKKDWILCELDERSLMDNGNIVCGDKIFGARTSKAFQYDRSRFQEIIWAFDKAGEKWRVKLIGRMLADMDACVIKNPEQILVNNGTEIYAFSVVDVPFFLRKKLTQIIKYYRPNF